MKREERRGLTEAIVPRRGDSEDPLDSAEDRDLYDNAPVGCLALDGDGMISAANRALAELLVLDLEAINGSRLEAFCDRDSAARLSECLSAVLETGEPRDVELRLLGGEREGRFVTLRATVAEGDAGRCRCALLDISARRGAEGRGPSPTDHRQAQLVDQLFDAVISTDLEQRILSWNRGAEAIYGWTADQAIGASLVELLARTVPGEIGAEAWTAEVLARGGWRGEVTERSKDGETLSVEISASVLREGADPIGIVSVARDVTRLRQSDARLEVLSSSAQVAEESRRFQQLFVEQLIESAPIVIAVVDLEGQIVAANGFLERLTGHRRHDLIGRRWLDALVEADEREAVARALEAAAAGYPCLSSRSALRTREGVLRAIEWDAIPLTDRGEVTDVLVIARDVTDREILERRLRHQASLVESVSDAHFSAGLEHAVRTWNPAAQRLLGWTREEMIGRPWTAVVPFAPESGTVAEMFDTLLAEGTWRGDGVQRDRDGNTIAVSMSANLATDPTGGRYAIYSVRDERQLRQLEAELRHAQKMEAVGRLASGIAHDFNNLLMGIIGCADIALSELEHPGAVATFLDEIKRAASSGAGITRQLLAFSRRREPDPTPFELGEAVAASAEMLRRLVGEDMPFEISEASGALWVDADRGQIEQVLMNLVVNARDAMPGGGELTIELSREELSSPLGRLAAGPCVVLAVSDTGCGMDEATRERLFEPFFTTKPAGQGTGLGLSTVYGIVKRAGGHIGVRSEPGRGSTFTIRLPAIAAPPDCGVLDLAISAVAGSGRIALVVEDEALVRLTCAHYLGELGFEVLEAGDVARAIELAGERREAIDLLITDVVLPGGRGDQIVSEISALCPGVAAVFMSAHPPAELARAGYVAADRPALHKPFSRDELERAVTAALGLVR